MPKPSLSKNSSGTISLITGGNKGVHVFLKGIISNVIIVWFG